MKHVNKQQGVISYLKPHMRGKYFLLSIFSNEFAQIEYLIVISYVRL